jgi:type II secretory pathway pseudopilin PulG
MKLQAAIRTSPLALLRTQRGELRAGLTPPLRKRRGGRGVRSVRGLTLIEVLVSVTFAALLLSALTVPLTVGLINRSQSQKLTEATNLAQAQIEEIRSAWLDPSNPTQAQQNFDGNKVRIIWKSPDPCGNRVAIIPVNLLTFNATAVNGNEILSDASQISPNDNKIDSTFKAIAIDADGDCTQDYWGQIMLGNLPDNNETASLKNVKRVVVRIFRLQDNPTSLSNTPVNTAKLSTYSQKPNAQNPGAPLVVLVSDIPKL